VGKLLLRYLGDFITAQQEFLGSLDVTLIVSS
jgi:hypothetical protein